MAITFHVDGDFPNTRSYLKRLSKQDFYSSLEKYAREGVTALEQATPKESGYTANSWSYKIERKKNSCTISWYNSSSNDGVPIVILLQHGHGTGTGGYVSGRDFINPSIKPIFDRISEKVWQEVKK